MDGSVDGRNLMRRVFEIEADEARPGRDSVWRALGMDLDQEPSDRIGVMVDQAVEIFVDLARPRGLVESLTVEEFASIYEGTGSNAPETPLAVIYPKAAHLALIAATLGAEVSEKIEASFDTNDFAFGYILDAVASEGAEKAADAVQSRYIRALADERVTATAHLRYSPGYCGWHISGQKRLFERLRPEDIGVELNESFLMRPLKSISGVVVSGGKEIHLFRNDYPFCSECTTKSCRERLKLMFSC